jgi:hypothetical protein
MKYLFADDLARTLEISEDEVYELARTKQRLRAVRRRGHERCATVQDRRPGGCRSEPWACIHPPMVIRAYSSACCDRAAAQSNR